MLEYAAGQKCWRLGQGNDQRMQSLKDGVFVEGDLSQHSPVAAHFIRQWLPIFSVPWRIKQSLEAAGISGCRTLTPAVMR